MGIVPSVLIGSAVLLRLMWIRRKKFEASAKKTVALHVTVTLLTTLGAMLGSVAGGHSFLGLRLYGFMILDTIALFFLCKSFQMEIGSLGDFLAAPIIAVCSIVKIPCLINGCCFGVVLRTDVLGNPVLQFPSQIVEFSIWALLSMWLFFLEVRGKHKNLLWSIATIWFGIFRFAVDFFRGNLSEMRLVILGLPAGRFWSVVSFLLGIAFLVYSFRKYYQKMPTPWQMIKAIFGINPIKKL